jgi:gas vesicle structural protein
MSATPRIDAEEVTLLELLDRVIDRGVYLSGDITISVADVDLIYLGLKLMLTSTERAEQMRASAAARSWGDLPRD